MPRAVERKLWTGMNGPRGFGGMCPQFNLAFSLEEAPTFGQGSSLIRKYMLQGTRIL
jgi:hypothetical protein